MDKEEKKIRLDGKSSASIILGVFVCFFMATVFMISNNLGTSYALPDEIDAKDIASITTKLETIAITENSKLPNGIAMQSKFSGTFSTNGKTYNVDMFCLEYDKGMPNADSTYNKVIDSTKYIDEGIAYIVNSAYANVNLNNGTDIKLSEDEYYAAQTAIWIYQLKVLGYQANPELEGKGGDTTESINKMWESVNANHSSGIASKIYNYVIGAQNVKNSTGVNAITLSIGNPELKLSSDKSYYETDAITVNVTTKNTNTTFDGFKFEINSNSYNTTVVDEAGNQITDLNSIAGKPFKIRVDATNLNAGSEANITGTFSGLFTTNSFLAYQGTSSTQIALLVTNNKQVESVELKAKVTVPDTGVDYSQYIYIIGAMVLVIGLSVIYVNAKAKQQQ